MNSPLQSASQSANDGVCGVREAFYSLTPRHSLVSQVHRCAHHSLGDEKEICVVFQRRKHTQTRTTTESAEDCIHLFLSKSRMHNPHCSHWTITQPTIVLSCLIYCIVLCVVHTRPMSLFVASEHNYRSNKEMNYIIMIIHSVCGHLRVHIMYTIDARTVFFFIFGRRSRNLNKKVKFLSNCFFSCKKKSCR